MTKNDWISSENPAAMLKYLWLADNTVNAAPGLRTRKELRSDRKLRLFACACLRWSWRGLTGEGSRKNVETAERIAEGELQPIPTLLDDPTSTDCMAICGHNAEETAIFGMMYAGNLFTDKATQATLLREIVGNPFQPAPQLWDHIKVSDDVLVESEPEYHLVKRQRGAHGAQPANATVIEVMPSGSVKVQPANGGPPGIWVAPKPTPLVPWLTRTVISLAEAAYEHRPGRKCEQCDGEKVVQASQGSFNQAAFVNMPCPVCRGTGRIEDGALCSDRLKILSDALEDDNCDNADILIHLRGMERCPNCTGEEDYIRVYCEMCEGSGRKGWIPKRGPCVRGCWVLDLLRGFS